MHFIYCCLLLHLCIPLIYYISTYQTVVSESDKPVRNNDQVQTATSEKKSDEDIKDDEQQQLDFDLDSFLTMVEPV